MDRSLDRPFSSSLASMDWGALSPQANDTPKRRGRPTSRPAIPFPSPVARLPSPRSIRASVDGMFTKVPVAQMLAADRIHASPTGVKAMRQSSATSTRRLGSQLSLSSPIGPRGSMQMSTFSRASAVWDGDDMDSALGLDGSSLLQSEPQGPARMAPAPPSTAPASLGTDISNYSDRYVAREVGWVPPFCCRVCLFRWELSELCPALRSPVFMCVSCVHMYVCDSPQQAARN